MKNGMRADEWVRMPFVNVPREEKSCETTRREIAMMPRYVETTCNVHSTILFQDRCGEIQRDRVAAHYPQRREPETVSTLIRLRFNSYSPELQSPRPLHPTIELQPGESHHRPTYLSTP